MRPLPRPSVLVCAAVATALAATAGAQVRLLGAVEAPAPRAAQAEPATVLDVLGTAQFALNADLARVVVLRLDAEPLAVTIDVRDMLVRGDTSQNVRLGDGDVVFVPAGRGARATFDQALDAATVACPTGARGALLCLRARHGADPLERAHAIRDICDLAAVGAAVLPTLRGCLDDDDRIVVREAVTALGVLGPRARAAAGELEALCSHEDGQVRARAKAALARVSEPDDDGRAEARRAR